MDENAKNLTGHAASAAKSKAFLESPPPPSKDAAITQADQLRREKRKAKTDKWIQSVYAEGAIRGVDAVLDLAGVHGLLESEIVAIYRRLVPVLRAMKAAKDTAEPLIDRAVARVIRELNEQTTKA